MSPQRCRFQKLRTSQSAAIVHWLEKTKWGTRSQQISDFQQQFGMLASSMHWGRMVRGMSPTISRTLCVNPTSEASRHKRCSWLSVFQSWSSQKESAKDCWVCWLSLNQAKLCHQTKIYPYHFQALRHDRLVTNATTMLTEHLQCNQMRNPQPTD